VLLNGDGAADEKPVLLEHTPETVDGLQISGWKRGEGRRGGGHVRRRSRRRRSRRSRRSSRRRRSRRRSHGGSRECKGGAERNALVMH
jgi:hypothetical protein